MSPQYLNPDDAVCDEHAPTLEEWRGAGGFDGWPAPLDIGADDAADTPTHCVECGRLIPHALTSWGDVYVFDAIEECLERGRRSPVVHAWADEYGAWCGAGDDTLAAFYALPLDRAWDTDRLRHYIALIDSATVADPTEGEHR